MTVDHVVNVLALTFFGCIALWVLGGTIYGIVYFTKMAFGL